MFHPSSRGGNHSDQGSIASIQQIRSPIKKSPARHASGVLTNVLSRRSKRTPNSATKWHEQIKECAATNNWDTIRNWLAAIQPSSHNDSASCIGIDLECSKTSMNSNPSSEASQRSTRMTGIRPTNNSNNGSFWNRLIKAGGSSQSMDRYGLLSVDDDNRTPLHAMLKSCTDQDLLLSMITAEPRAATVKSSKDRLALHFAVVHRHGWPVIAAIIDAHPPGLSSVDTKGLSPLQYAIGNAVRESSKARAPTTYWMKLLDDNEEPFDAQTHEAFSWQVEQKQRWAVVHWLLLSSATHPQSSLSLGCTGRQNNPMLVEALVHAAPPAVVSLLIGASVMMLSYNRKVTSFAASTLYTCITRHYPESILRSLASQLLVFRESGARYDKVRDETGVGFVAAQYISGCFTQPQQGSVQREWELSKDFSRRFKECIEDGEISEHDPAIYDWWMKIEHLLAFCAAAKKTRSKARRKQTNEDETNPSQLPQKYLLHAALSNTDTPPLLIKALLSFYPESIHLPQSSGALPLHLAASVRDYIPRYYEREAFPIRKQPETSLELVLEADPSALWKRWNGLLPFHCAVACGRTMESLTLLLDADPEKKQLLQRDPKVGLYPFQVAATYWNRSDEDSFRWTCVARNKFSNAVWNGKLDRDKAAQVLRAEEHENLQRLSTIFTLLRLSPDVIRGPKSPSDTDEPPVTNHTSTTRQLYLDFCYDSKTRQALPTKKLLGDALRKFKSSDETPLPSTFDVWWDLIKSSIRPMSGDSFHKHLGLVPNTDMCSSSLVEAPLLHRALMRNSVPPEVTSLIIASERHQLTTCLPGTRFHPIHIVSISPPYHPTTFETYNCTALQLLLETDPNIASIPVNGCLPLHLAIYTDKSQGMLTTLVGANPRALRIRDRHSRIFPFQLAASLSRSDPKSSQKETESPASIRRLGIVYSLLRHDPGVIEQTREAQWSADNEESEFEGTGISETSRDCDSLSCSSEDESSEYSSSYGTVGSSLVGNYKMQQNNPVVQPSTTDTSSATDESSFVVAAKTPRSPVRTKTPSSLMLLLSQSTVGQRNGALFDCDASVLSNVDVLSTLTSTLHTKADRRFTHNTNNDSDNDDSIDLFDSDDSSVTETSEGSNFDDFAEDSGIQSMGLPLLIEGTKGGSDGDSLGGCSVNSEVCFKIRRVPRSATEKDFDEIETPALVTLTKQTPRALLTELKGHSLSTRSISSRPSVSKGISQSRLKYALRSERSSGNDFFKTSAPSFQIKECETAEMSSITGYSDHTFRQDLSRKQIKEHPGLLGGTSLDPSDTEDSSSMFKSPVEYHSSTSEGKAPSSRKEHYTNARVKLDLSGQSTANLPKSRSLLGSVDPSDAHDDSGFMECGESGREPDVFQAAADPMHSRQLPELPACFPKRDCAYQNNAIPSVPSVAGSVRDIAIDQGRSAKPKTFDRATMKWVEQSNDTDPVPDAEKVQSSRPSTTNKAKPPSDHFPSRPKSLPHNPFLRKPPPKAKKQNHYILAPRESPQNQIRCVTCKNARREVLMVPCKHLCICRRCSSNQSNITHCPLCEAPVVARMLIF